MLGTAISQQKVTERYNGRLVEILGAGDLSGIIRTCFTGKVLRLR